jgi:hypothetical protein
MERTPRRIAITSGILLFALAASLDRLGHGIRAVDLLGIFGCGMLFGVNLLSLILMLRKKSPSL